MPSRYGRRSRRTYAVRARRTRRRTMVRKRRARPRMYRSVGIPKQMFAKLRYTTYSNLSLAPAATNFVEYRLNSLHDPEVAIGGNQPYYFDQYAALYAKYLVYGCKIQVNVTCNSANSNVLFPSIVMVAYGGDTSPGWTSNLNMQDAKGALWRRPIPGQNGFYMTKYYNNAAVIGVPKNKYAVDDLFSSSVTTDPFTVSRVQLNVQNYDLGATVVVQFHVRLTYYCKFYDRKEPAPS